MPNLPCWMTFTCMKGWRLLALRGREGVLERSRFALGGAVLAALCLCGRLGIVPGRKGVIEVVDRKPTGEAVLDDCLEECRPCEIPLFGPCIG